MSLLTELLNTLFERRAKSETAVDIVSRALPDLVRDLLGSRDDISSRMLVTRILATFEAEDDAGKHAFFTFLARDLDIDPARARTALEMYEAEPGGDSYGELMAACEPPRQEVIRKLNQIPGGTGRLVAMRADLHRAARQDAPSGRLFAALDLDFRHLFRSWFNRGFLVLRPITWESPAHILERIINYEAVHAIESWDDLRARLEPADRRCFALFHPAMPDEPLIFVEIALTRGVPSSIHDILAEDRKPLTEDETDTAVFYSISNCQKGLAGISFGDFLIKQAVEDLSVARPGLSTFVTLSPLPGFADWIRDSSINPPADDPTAMRQLAARYLLEARRDDGTPRDPVARFHLGNGACIHDVHANADLSPRGVRQAHGVMVNYLYEADKIAQNHERFAAKGEVVATDTVRALARAALKSEKKGSADAESAV